MNAPIPPAAVAPIEEPRGEADLATLLDEPASRRWYRSPMLWGGIALLVGSTIVIGVGNYLATANA